MTYETEPLWAGDLPPVVEDEREPDIPWAEDHPTDPARIEHLSWTELYDLQSRVWSVRPPTGHNDAAVEEETGSRPGWRASNLGMCLRRQVLWRAGIAETRKESERELADKHRRFAWGSALHNHLMNRTELTGLLIAKEGTLEDDDLSVMGHFDLLWGGRVQRDLPNRAKYWSPEYVAAVLELRAKVEGALGDKPVPVTLTEFKTTSSWSVREWTRSGPPLHARMQLATYRLLAELHPDQLPEGQLPARYAMTVVGRDAVQPLDFELGPADLDLALSRLMDLNEAWATGAWPNCTCGTTPTMEWEGKWCPYLDPADTSTCCGQTLLDRLEASVKGAA